MDTTMVKRSRVVVQTRLKRGKLLLDEREGENMRN